MMDMDLMREKALEAKKNKPALLAASLDKLPEKSKQYVRSLPDAHTLTYSLHLSGNSKLSPMKAIKYKCLDCSCWDRQEVKECTNDLCPLHHLRPFANKGE